MTSDQQEANIDHSRFTIDHSPVIVFPNCKINLGLHISRKRSDGYHDIETIFYPVAMTDVLEVLPSSQSPAPGSQLAAHSSQLFNYGLTVAGDPADNLCMKAWRLLKTVFPALPTVNIHLIKHVPMGAGLGGGSANGAFMLKLLNELFALNLSTDQLISYSLQLGSDCPFFINNQPCYATGRGEVMSPVELDLSGYRLVLVHPGIHINTGWAFAQVQLAGQPVPTLSLRDIIRQPVAAWKDSLVNDFEVPVCKTHPLVNDIKEKLYAAGATYAAMSGSGSTVFGLFSKKQPVPREFPAPFTVADL